MTLDPAGAQLPATLWLLAVVLAWPAGNPTAAVVLLAAQAVGFLLTAGWQLLAPAPLAGPAHRRDSADRG